MRWLYAFLIPLGFATSAPAQPTPEVVNTFINFDAVNAGKLPAQDLELELPGLPYCGVRDWYKGARSWGLHPRMHYLDRKLPLVEIDWTDPFRPILPGERRHFGVALDPAAPPVIPALAWWSVKVRPIPFPWQKWEPGQGVVVDVIDLSADAPGGVEIARDYAVLDRAIPLDDLLWDQLATLPWRRVDAAPVPLQPGGSLKLEIPVKPDPLAAALVRYTVRAEGVEMRVINEAVLEGSPASALVSIADVLSNFDIHNRTNLSYEDFEIHLMCLQPSDVIGWYRGALGWGMPPRINQIPGGTEVLWADPFNPWVPSRTYHFGIRLRPDAPPPIVTAWWTKKLPIPVPWQGWRIQPGPAFFNVIDRIVLSPQSPEPVAIQREYAVTRQVIPLEMLQMDLRGVDWQPVRGDPVTMEPGSFFDITIPIQPDSRAVLVRYTVARKGEPEPVTRFINEAVLSQAAAAPAIAGSLSNFDVLNLTGGRVHDLELWLPGVRKEWITDWYNGPGAWGVHPGEFRIPAVPGTNIPAFTEILWKDPLDPLLPGAMAHFGVAVDPAWMVPGPREARAWWSVKVAPIPLPWQWWRVDPRQQAVVDVIRNTSDQLVYVRRDAAILAAPVELDDLNWDLQAGWQAIDRGPVQLPPGESLSLSLPFMAPNMAALVRYEVFPAVGVPAEARVLNEAVIEAGRLALALVNFDAHNFTDWRVADLELDLLGVDPEEVVHWYRGPRAWGNPPRISQIPQGTEVMWADPYNPLPHCQWRHFGIALRPEAMDLDNTVGLVGVRAAWTIKVPIPLPWQTWRPEPGRVVDVIQASPAFPGAVRVLREYAAVPASVPLDELNWDLPAVQWRPVPGDPVTLDPGKVLELPVDIDSTTEAVLVRYTTEDANGNKVRVMNGATIVMPPPVCPCVSDLRCDPMADGRVALAWRQMCRNVSYIFTVDGVEVTPISHSGSTAVVKIDPPCGTHKICVIAVLPDGRRCPPICCEVDLPPCPSCPCISNLKCDPLAASGEVQLTWALAPQCKDAKLEITLDGVVVAAPPAGSTSAKVEIDPYCGTHTLCVIATLPGGTVCPAVCCTVALPPCISNLKCDPLAATGEVQLTWTLAPPCKDARLEITLDGAVVAAPPPGSTSAKVKIDPFCGTHTICVVAIWPDGKKCEPVCCKVELLACPTCPCISNLKCDPLAASGEVQLTWALAPPCKDAKLEITLDGAVVARPPSGSTSARIKIDPFCGTHEICVIAILPDGTACPRVCCKVDLPACPSCPCVSNLACTPNAAAGEVALAWTLAPQCKDATFEFTLDANPVVPVAQTPTSARIKITPFCGTHTLCVIAVLPDGTKCPPVCCRVELPLCPSCPCVSNLVCDPLAASGEVQLVWALAAQCKDAKLEITLDGAVVAAPPAGSTSAKIKISPYCGTHRLCVVATLPDGTVCPPVCCTVTLPLCPSCPCITNLACDPISGTNLVAVAWTLAPQCAAATFEFTVDGTVVVPVALGPNSAQIKIDPFCGTHRICVIAKLPDGTRCDPVCCTVTLPPCPSCPCVSDLKCEPIADRKEVGVTWALAPQCADAKLEFTLDGNPVVPVASGPNWVRIKVDPFCGTHRICVIAKLPDGTSCDPVCCTVRLRPCFIRADTDGNGAIIINDGIQILDRLFTGRPAFGSNCDKTGDFDDDGNLTIADAISIFNLLFANGREPNPPYPRCGDDLREDNLTCDGPVPACP